MRSTMNRSGRSVAMRLMASLPPAASTTRIEASSRYSRIWARWIGSSSTMNTAFVRGLRFKMNSSRCLKPWVDDPKGDQVQNVKGDALRQRLFHPAVAVWIRGGAHRQRDGGD